MYPLVAQMVKNLPAMQESQFQSLGWKRSPGEGNGYPHPYSYLENSTDRGARWATVNGDRTERLTLALFTFLSGENMKTGNWNTEKSKEIFQI